MVPGSSAIGVADTRELKKGDLVFYDPTVRARDNALAPQTILRGILTPSGGLSSTSGIGALAEKKMKNANIAASQAAVQGEVDCALEIMDHNAPVSILRAGLLSLRSFGTLVLRSGRSDMLEVPWGPIMSRYLQIKGCFMYPEYARQRIDNMIEAGLIKINLFMVPQTFSLNHINEAL
ncbi:hypothetical protein BZG36_04042 [Bifiguratus adelaidae]|uniref:Uncharacterized protein n=1 Tax=Bifiguratus adelaidae TaxID=1938954 RepID=A0A261Y062_9FUNG|nr:hypothetical protein BZG36_04042 [Bifiguratus adelaidae]